MELQFSRTTGMLIVILVTITARTMNTMQNPNLKEGPVKWINHPGSGINTKKTTAGTKSDNSIKDKNTMQKPPNSEKKGIWIYRESGINAKTTTAGTNMGKDEFSTTDNSIKDTKNEQENLSYSTVPTMHSAYSTKDSTALSHHQDNSELIGIIVGLIVSLLVVVVGLVFLCYHSKFLCFIRNEKCNLGMSSSQMLDEEKIQTQDMTVDEDVVPMLNEKNKTPVMSDDEDTDLNVDIKTEDERYPVRTKDKPIIKSLKLLNSIQPSDASEENKNLIHT